MSTHDVDGLNAGYARALLDEYLENPEAVPSEWRALFESGDSGLVATHPGIARLLATLPGLDEPSGNGHAAPAAGGSYAARLALVGDDAATAMHGSFRNACPTRASCYV